MREIDKEERSPRFIVFLIGVGIVFLLLIARLFFLQILNATIYEAKALKNRIRTNIVKATRGEIYDREGKLLAKNVTGYQLIHYDTKPLTSEDIKILVAIQDMTESQIDKRLSKERKINQRIFRTISQFTHHSGRRK